jgi:hypothetical protein
LKNKSTHNSGTSSNNKKEQRLFNSSNVAPTSIVTENNFSNDMWIFDSGARCHYRQSVEGLTDVKDIDKLTKIDNSGPM